MIKRRIEIATEEVHFILTLKKDEIFNNETRMMLFNQVNQNKSIIEQMKILTEIVREIEHEREH